MLFFPALAHATPWTYSGDITYATDYIFRGITQTQGRASVQGGYVLNTGFGLEFGTWGSNVHFEDEEASLELDAYVSFGFDLQGDLGLEVGVIDYRYPGSSHLNFSEIYFSMAVLGISVNVNHSDDYETMGAAATWTKIGYEFPLLSRNLFLGVEYGSVEAEEDIFMAENAAGEVIESKNGYSHWGLNIGFTLGTSTLLGSLIDHNRPGCGDFCDLQTVVSWTKSF